MEFTEEQARGSLPQAPQNSKPAWELIYHMVSAVKASSQFSEHV